MYRSTFIFETFVDNDVREYRADEFKLGSRVLINQFLDRAEAITFLTEHLTSDGMGNNANALAQALVDEWRVLTPNEGGESTHRAVFKPTRWVIRDGDLQLLSSLFVVLRDVTIGSVLASSGQISDTKMLSLALSVGKTLTRLALSMHKKGVQLEEKEFFVLMLLREDPSGKPLEFLQAAFHARYGDGSDIKGVLERLAGYPTRGDAVALVRLGESDRWFAQDV